MSTSKIFYEVVSGHGQRKSSVEEAERSKMSHSYGVRIRGVAGVGYECKPDPLLISYPEGGNRLDEQG